MTEETIEDIVKAFHADKRLNMHLSVGQIEIDDIYIGIKAEGSSAEHPSYSEMLYYIDTFTMVSACTIEHIEYFKFSVENEGLEGTITVCMNSSNRTVRCETEHLVVKEPFASQGYVVAGLSLKWGAHGGDPLPNRAERRKKKKLNRH